VTVASYLNWKRSLMSEGDSVPKGTLEYDYCHDLDLSEDAVKWKEAIEFTFAGKPPRTMDDFWGAVREEYFRSAGKLKDTEPQEIVFD